MAQAVSFSKTGVKHEAGARLEKSIFGLEPSHELIDRAYRVYLAASRSAHPVTLSRGEVRGGGKKPWRQKGTGRARVGSIRVPNWRGGGVVFGPTGAENHTLGLPLRMKRLAIRHALSLRAASSDIILLEDFTTAEAKTSQAAALLGKMKLEGAVLLAVSERTDLIDRATRNLPGLNVVQAKYLNVYNIMSADKIVITQKALDMVKDWLGDSK